MIKAVKIILVVLSVIFSLSTNYYGLLFSFSTYLLFKGIFDKKINVKIFSWFFLIYLLIPFLNISTYRGIISINTLIIYCVTQFLVLFFVDLFEQKAVKTSPAVYVSTLNTALLYKIHLIIIYAALAYAYATVGIIIVNQDLRFNIRPTIEYIIKSGLALPLIWFYSDKFSLKFQDIFFKFLLPILPSILIGSRGTFLMILISFFVSLYLISNETGSYLNIKYKSILKNFKKFILWGGIVGVFALYSGFYLRRDGVELITASKVLQEYSFDSKGIGVMAILPIYLNLRETIGITETIISQNISNIYYPYPFFVAELMSILPGEQVPPGRVLGREIFMAEDYGLTPGIIGGLYIDFRLFSIVIIILIVIFIINLYNKGRYNISSKLLYAFTIVQFLHLYHRVFLKL
jgi:hypothetical protein